MLPPVIPADETAHQTNRVERQSASTVTAAELLAMLPPTPTCQSAGSSLLAADGAGTPETLLMVPI